VGRKLLTVSPVVDDMVEHEPGHCWSRVVGSPAMESERTVSLGNGWIAGLAALTSGVLVIWGCDRGTAKAEPELQQAPTATVTAAAAASRSVDDPSFKLEMRQAGTYAKHAAAKVEVVLEAKPPYKVNEKYPIKLKLEPADGVKFDSDVVGKDHVEMKSKTALMTVGFTPEASGVKRIAGKLKFSVCSEERCLMETRELALDVDVK
jgi:hypothetical protein